jgi:hypothetical protein
MKTAAKTILSLALSLNLTVASAAAATKVAPAAGIKAAILAYKPELLISRYASWGIDPDKHLASINLKESWTRFK